MRHRVSNWSWRGVWLVASAGIFLIGGAWLGAAAPPAPIPAAEVARRGARVFRRERCFFCHTLNETPASAAFDPARSGLDLGHEGGRRTDDWQGAHLINPGAGVGGWGMPSVRHLPPRALIR